MAGYVRPGRGQHINGTTAVATVEKWAITVGRTTRVMIVNTHGATGLEVFFTKEAADLGAGAGWLLAAGASLTLEIEVIEFWTLAAGACTFRAIVTGRP